MGIHHHKINAKVSNAVLLYDAGNKQTAYQSDSRGANFIRTNLEYLESDSVDFRITTSFTVGGWVKTTGTADGNAFFVCARWGTTVGTSQFGISRFTSTTYKFRVFNSSFVESSVTSSAFASNTNWVFVVCQYDSVGQEIRISVDGGAWQTTAFTTPINGAGAQPLQFARNQTFYSNQVSDNWFYYNEAIDLSVVQSLYNSGNGISYDSLSAAQKTDLVSWWSMNETSQERTDSHSSNDLTEFNTVGFDAGKVTETDFFFLKNQIDQTQVVLNNGINITNGSLIFDGVDDIIDLNSALTTIDSDTKGTIEAWIRTNSLSTSQYIFTVSHDNDPSDEYYIAFGINATGHLRLVANIDDGALDLHQRSTNALANTTDFHHVIVVQDGTTNDVKLYINGVEETIVDEIAPSPNKDAWFNSLVTTGNTSLMGAVKIGGTAPQQHFDGDIRYLKYYNEILTTEEIQRNYLSQKHR